MKPFFYISCSDGSDVAAAPGRNDPSREVVLIYGPSGVGLSSACWIIAEFGPRVVIYQISDRDRLFSLTVSSFVDGDPQSVASLPGVFDVGVLFGGSDDRLVTYTSAPSHLVVPSQELPAVWTCLPMTNPQIATLVACPHFCLLRYRAPEMRLGDGAPKKGFRCRLNTCRAA